MKRLPTIFLIFFLCCSQYCVCFSKNLTTPQDSILVKYKNHFISIQTGGGLGWRNYLRTSNDFFSDYPSTHTQAESPGLAYNFAMNYGFTKKKWNFSLGLEYNSVQYNNDNAPQYVTYYTGSSWNYSIDSILADYEYNYIHESISIASTATYILGRQNNWRISASLKLGWLVGYSEIIQRTSKYDNLALYTKNKLGKYPIGWIGAIIERKIIESKKLKIFIDCKLDYSSPVGYKTELTPYDEPFGGAPHYRDEYKFKPHCLMASYLQINLEYKLY